MRRTRTKALTGVALVSVVGAAGWAVIGRSGGSAQGEQPSASTVTATTAPVARTDVANRRQVTGTLGHAGTYEVIATGQGTLTRLAATGRVVNRGDTVYETDGSPVVLLYGRRPPWRAFSLGMTDGADVRQLETNLRALGYGAGMTVDKHFSYATYWAVRSWQDDARLPVTGTVPLGQIVFLPAAIRISAHDLKPGMRVQPGTRVAHGTGDRPAVTVRLSPAELPQVRVGDRVVVTLPDGATRTGKITTVGAVATTAPTTGGGDPGQPSEQTAPVTITVTGTIRGFLDQAEVTVAITQELRENVLAVPVTALRGVPGGTYEVVMVAGTSTRRLPVETGLFDELAGVVEVTGAGLAEGQLVEVPRDGS